MATDFDRRPYRVVITSEKGPLVLSYHMTSDDAYSAGEQRAGSDTWCVQYYSPAGWARVRQMPTRAASGI